MVPNIVPNHNFVPLTPLFHFFICGLLLFRDICGMPEKLEQIPLQTLEFNQGNTGSHLERPINLLNSEWEFV